MDIQDDKNFAALPEVAKLYQACKERDLTIAEREYLKGARDAWQAAKVQAVPEGFVLMPKEPTDEIIEAMNEFDYRNDYSDMDGAYRAIVETLEKAQAVPEGFVLIKASDRDQEMLELIDQRDYMESQAEELKDKLQTLYGVNFGEHSSCNFPFQNAIDYDDSDLVLVPREMQWHKADDLACLEWGRHVGLFCSENRDMSALQVEEFRLRWCKNKANKIMSDYKAMIEAQEPTND